MTLGARTSVRGEAASSQMEVAAGKGAIGAKTDAIGCPRCVYIFDKLCNGGRASRPEESDKSSHAAAARML